VVRLGARAATDPVSGFEHDDGSPRLVQEPCGGETCEPRSHDHDVGVLLSHAHILSRPGASCPSTDADVSRSAR
jgi:hypothetical protein